LRIAFKAIAEMISQFVLERRKAAGDDSVMAIHLNALAQIRRIVFSSNQAISKLNGVGG
jgi:hypothetical protein